MLQIHQVALQELLPLSAARGAHHLVEPTVISQVAEVQRILLRKALASEMCGSVFCVCVCVCVCARARAHAHVCLCTECFNSWNDVIMQLLCEIK
jgi:hypothetical protein